MIKNIKFYLNEDILSFFWMKKINQILFRNEIRIFWSNNENDTTKVVNDLLFRNKQNIQKMFYYQN